MRVFSVGHSVRTSDEFVALVRAHGVELLVDVRTRPFSKRNPQFDTDALAASLADAEVSYRHMRDLGGLRASVAGSINTALPADGFRGYADWMQTEAFARALDELVALASSSCVTVMCAEADHAHCHRSFLSDALVARGVEVVHIASLTEARAHVMTSHAVVDGPRVTYPARNVQLDLLAAKEGGRRE